LERRVQRGLLPLVLGAVCVAAEEWNRYYELNQKYYTFANRIDCSKFKQNFLAAAPQDAASQQAADQLACTCTTTVEGSVVLIEDGYAEGSDQLVCDDCTALGFTANFQVAAGVMYIKPTSSSEDKTIADYAQAIESVHFITSDTGSTAKTMTYNFGRAFYSAHTRHYYEFFSHAQINWFTAQTNCASKKLLGLPGYLITVTSAEEQSVAVSKLDGQGWMGASDAGAEGVWRWVVGPEGCPSNVATGGLCDFGNPADGTYPYSNAEAGGQATGSGPDLNGGTYFWKGTAATYLTETQPTDSNGNPYYTSWQQHEPNNYNGEHVLIAKMQGEDFGQFRSNGKWNDLSQEYSHMEGYICEWGGIGDTCLTPQDATSTKILLAGCNVFSSSEATCTNSGYCLFDATQTPSCKPKDQATCAEELVSGGASTCVRNTMDGVRCWGANGYGRLGQGDTAARGAGPNTMGSYLYAINFGTGVTMSGFRSGDSHVCGLRNNDGKIMCWGRNDKGQLGIGSQAAIGDDNNGEMQEGHTVPVPGSCKIKQLEAYANHNCLLCENGAVYCWGSNQYGELALGTTIDMLGTTSGWTMVPAELGGTVEALIPGTHAFHTCAIFDSVTFACWGRNANGGLGNGGTDNIGRQSDQVGSNLRKVTAPAGKTLQSGCLGAHHTCLLYGDGQVECFGQGERGQLGTTSINDKLEPTGTTISLTTALGTTMGAPNKVGKLRCGSYHVCVVDETGLKTACWGYNNQGQLGLGDAVNRGGTQSPAMSDLPAVNLKGERVIELALGELHTCASLASGVKCWGSGYDGRLGTESETPIGDGQAGSTAMADMKTIDLPCESELTLPAGWQARSISIPQSRAPHDQYSPVVGDNEYEVTLNSFGGGKADFWWINASMRGANVYDITPTSSQAPGTPSIFPVDTSFTMTCKRGRPCDMFVFIYHDPPISSTTNGGLIHLVDDGWEAASCAPTFTLPNSPAGCHYKMVALRNTVESGESVTVKIEDRPGAYIILAVVPKVQCVNTYTPEQCQDTHSQYGALSTCKHDGSACVDDWCTRRTVTRPPGFTRPPTNSCPHANNGLVS